VLKAEQIPDEVVEAALKKRGLMREAIADALKAWPGVIHNGHWLLFPHTKLPLPQEPRDE
jgi:hypothetical protein